MDAKNADELQNHLFQLKKYTKVTPENKLIIKQTEPVCINDGILARFEYCLSEFRKINFNFNS